MRAYLIGFGAGLGLIVALAGAPYLHAPANSPGELAWLVTLLLCVPVCAAWVGAGTIDALRPRRVFDVRVERIELAMLAGAIAALASFVVIVAWRTYLGERIGDGALVGASAALCSALVTLALPRVRRGRCVLCGEALDRMDRCRECGTVVVGTRSD